MWKRCLIEWRGKTIKKKVHVRECYQKGGWEKGISNVYIEKNSCYKCNQRKPCIVMIKTKEWSLGQRLKWASLLHI